MKVRRHADVDRFLATAGDFLAAREAEHNLIFGVLSTLRETPEAYSGPAYLGSVHDAHDRDVAAAIEALAEDTVDRDLPGVLGPVGTVETFVLARQAAGGPTAVQTETEQVYRLSAVRPPRPVAGSRRTVRVD